MDPKHNSGRNIILDFVAMLYIRFKVHFQTFKIFCQIFGNIDAGDRIFVIKRLKLATILGIRVVGKF